MANSYMLSNNKYPDTIKKMMAILDVFKLSFKYQKKEVWLLQTEFMLEAVGSGLQTPKLDGVLHALIKCQVYNHFNHYASRCPTKRGNINNDTRCHRHIGWYN